MAVISVTLYNSNLLAPLALSVRAVLVEEGAPTAVLRTYRRGAAYGRCLIWRVSLPRTERSDGPRHLVPRHRMRALGGRGLICWWAMEYST